MRPPKTDILILAQLLTSRTDSEKKDVPHFLSLVRAAAGRQAISQVLLTQSVPLKPEALTDDVSLSAVGGVEVLSPPWDRMEAVFGRTSSGRRSFGSHSREIARMIVARSGGEILIGCMELPQRGKSEADLKFYIDGKSLVELPASLWRDKARRMREGSHGQGSGETGPAPATPVTPANPAPSDPTGSSGTSAQGVRSRTAGARSIHHSITAAHPVKWGERRADKRNRFSLADMAARTGGVSAQSGRVQNRAYLLDCADQDFLEWLLKQPGYEELAGALVRYRVSLDETARQQIVEAVAQQTDGGAMVRALAARARSGAIGQRGAAAASRAGMGARSLVPAGR